MACRARHVADRASKSCEERWVKMRLLSSMGREISSSVGWREGLVVGIDMGAADAILGGNESLGR
jgi:hypothetical protein